MKLGNNKKNVFDLTLICLLLNPCGAKIAQVLIQFLFMAVPGPLNRHRSTK